MESTSQNSEFLQNSTLKSTEECLDEQRKKYYAESATSSSSSGGDISLHIKSVSSIETQCTTHKDESDPDEEAKSENSDISSSLTDVKRDRTKLKRTKSKQDPIGLGSKLKIELSKYKNELKDYNSITRDLEEKYKKLNIELNDMHQKHQRFVASRKKTSTKSPRKAASFTGTSTSTSELSLKRKSTQVLRKRTTAACTNSRSQFGKSKQVSVDNLTLSYSTSDEFKRRVKKSVSNVEPNSEQERMQKHLKVSKFYENKENEAPKEGLTSRNCVSSIKELCSVVQNVLHSSNQPNNSYSQKDKEYLQLQATVDNLQNEHEHFKSIIKQQQNCLQDYHTRCLKAQQIMQTQQTQIKKLNTNNHQLETEITTGIDNLRAKIDSKLKDIAQLPQMMREEQLKYDKICKENTALSERLRTLQSEAHELKLKIEELGRRKVATINRLKNAERDLKIFKNYNTALKHEKRKLCDELQKVKLQLDSMQNSSKRTLTRQREQSEKLRRDLQKRVFELELKLSRSKNSTTSLIQERDSLIAELQTQLNTLVHNFEVSQKHIRVLRRHIYTMTGGSSGAAGSGGSSNNITGTVRLPNEAT